MISEDPLRRIAIRQIDTADTTFRITTREDTNDIQTSIERIGLLQPPVLQPLPAGYRVVCGFRRLLVLRELARQRVTAVVLPHAADAFDCARRAIADNALQRTLNPIEQSRALKLLADHMPDGLGLEREAAALGLPSNPDLIAKLRELRRLDRSIQAGVLRGRISLAMALELGACPGATAARLVDLFETLRLGLNRQREVLLLLREVAAREDRSLEEILADAAVQPLLETETEGAPAAAGRLLDGLRRRRFPEITRKTGELEQKIAALDFDPGIRLSAPPDLESPLWRLTFSFQTAKELQRRLQNALEMSRDPRLKSILELEDD
jgi:ParB family chromosome partitioning protein